MSKDFGKQSCLGPREKALLWSFVASVEETVFKLIVTMQITKKRNSSLSLSCQGHTLLQKVYLWMNIWNRITPSSVQVYSSETGSRITHHNSIRIDHRYQLNYEVVEYLIVLFIVLAQLMNDMTHYEATMRFCSMKPGLDIHA